MSRAWSKGALQGKKKVTLMDGRTVVAGVCNMRVHCREGTKWPSTLNQLCETLGRVARAVTS
eukprot:scaffold123545_cov21-Tisochrysis_lutea.AAC.2